MCLMIALAWTASPVIGYEAALTVLTVVGLLLVLAGFRNPALGLLGLAIVATMDSIARSLLLTGGLLRFNTFNYVLMVYTLVYLPQIVAAVEPQTKLLMVFVALLTVQLWGTENLELGVQHLLDAAAPFGLLVCMRRAGMDGGLWCWMALASSLTSALSGFAYQLERHDPEVNPNAWAIMPLTALFSVCLAMHTNPGRRMRVALLALTTLNLAWVVFSASRGAMLVASAVLLYLLTTAPGLGRKLSYLAGCATAITVLSMAFPNMREYAEHRVSMLWDDKRTVSNRTSGRLDLATAGWELFRQHPLGVGTGGFSREFARLDRPDAAFASHEKQAHSGWVKTLAESGIVGITLLAAYVVSFAVSGWRRRQFGLWPIGLLPTMCLAVSLLSVEFQSKGLWFLAAGTTLVLHRRTDGAPESNVAVRARSIPDWHDVRLAPQGRLHRG